MFARFRDENATVISGFSTPGVFLAPESTDAFAPSVQRLRLQDGRMLCWSEFGCRHGYPILYMHREGSCRLEARFFDESARAAGFRLIAIDRPGTGGSDYGFMPTAEAVARDYEQWIHQLGLRRFGVLSLGGGSVFALLLANRMPERCAFAGLLAPVEQPCQLSSNRLVRGLFTCALRALIAVRRKIFRRDPVTYFERWAEHLSASERRFLEHKRISELLEEISIEAVQQGAAGVVQDIWLGLGGSRLSDYSLAMPVHVWSSVRESIESGLAGEAEPLVRRHTIRNQNQLFAEHVASQVFQVLSTQRNVVG